MKKLSALLNDLFLLTNGRIADLHEKARLEELIQENGFGDEDAMPEWFCNLLNHVVSKKATIGRIPYLPQPDDGNVSNLLAELEPIIHAKWDDYGEAIEISFDFGVFVYIGRMGRFWEVIVEN